MENLSNQWKLNASKTQIVDYLGDEILVGAEWRVSNLKNLTLASKAPEMLERLKDCVELIRTLDNVNSDLLNKLSQLNEYKDYTKYSGFVLELVKLIKEFEINE